MDSAGADFDLAVLLADSRQARNAGDIDEGFGFAQTKLHERHQTVAACDQFRFAIGGTQLRNCIVERRRPGVDVCPAELREHLVSGERGRPRLQRDRGGVVGARVGPRLGVEPLPGLGETLAAAGALTQGQLVSYYGGSYAQAGSVITLIYLFGLVLIWFAPETSGKPLPD